MMPSGKEIAQGLFGAWRLLRLDSGAMALFDRSVEGFWKSFYAAVLVAPGYLILVMIHLSNMEPGSGPLRILVIQSLAYVISWIAFPLVMYYVAEGIGRGSDYIAFIVAFNWAKVVQMGIYLPVSLLAVSDMMPAETAGFLTVLTSILILAYEWFITRTALGVTGLGAAGIVVLDLILGILVTATADGMVL